MDGPGRRRLRVVHLFSSWKWTGPAEPVSLLVEQLRRLELEVDFHLPPPPQPDFESLQRELDQRGLAHTLFPQLDRKKLHCLPSAVWRLARALRRAETDIVHTHHGHDHWVAGLAVRTMARPTRVVRSDYYRDGLPGWEARIPLRAITDAVVTFSEMSAKQWREGVGMRPQRVALVPPVFDSARTRAADLSPVRPRLGLENRHFVVGLACRLQRNRYLHVFMEAVAEVCREMPNLRVVILGRSSQIGQTVVGPIRKLGLRDVVVFVGHRKEDYYSYLSAMNLLVYTRAGSDGTGRGLLEAMGLGVPVLVNRTGMLPEFVEPGRSAMLFDGSGPDLKKKILLMARRPQLRNRLAALARSHAHEAFHPARQAAQVEAFYRGLVA